MRYEIKDMREWEGANFDICICDPPFGIGLHGSGEKQYNRDADNVSTGYVEWGEDDYAQNINDLLQCFNRNTKANSSCLIFSGWKNSRIIHQQIVDSQDFSLRAKLYWIYNFAAYKDTAPSHNVYEIFWATKSDEYYYDNNCEWEHCTVGESNLASIISKRDYITGGPKYPTRLPPSPIRPLISHFTEEGDVVFDPCAGTGMIGIVAESMGREAVLGEVNENAEPIFEDMKARYSHSEFVESATEASW